MKALGWAFFGLAVIILVGYVLNRGFYVGQEVRREPFTAQDGSRHLFYNKYCRYVQLTGVQEKTMTWTATSIEEAERPLCPMFYE